MEELKKDESSAHLVTMQQAVALPVPTKSLWNRVCEFCDGVGRKPITEEQGIHKQWYEEARKMTIKKLPKFMRKLDRKYQHDYGTICHAVTASALAGAYAMDHGSQGDITGFQAGYIMWNFISKWMCVEGQPLRLIYFEKMLYPQYESMFEKTITADTWQWLQKQARTNLDEQSGACEKIRAHWQSIVDGKIPFGCVVKEE
jgi:hypothetical protein